MLSYQDTQNALHVRTIDFTLQEYMFVLQTVFGEDLAVAYANVYDSANFKRFVPSENEDEYLAKFKHDAETLMEQQQCKHLKEYLETEYQRDIQEKASTLKDYKFTGEDVQRLLNNLLHDRSKELSESSVRDILALIRSMYDSGALDSGNDNFQSHFITIAKKYDALCPTCGHELYAVEGLDIKCAHCGQVFKWDGMRFWPHMDKL